MKILLLSPPYLQYYMRNARCDYVSISDTQWPPIWLSYCGALLEEHGHQVRLIDAPASKLSHKEALDRSIKFSPDLTVVYSSTKSEDNDIEFSKRIKEETGCKSVFVGPFVSINPEGLMKKSGIVDYAIKGEFEYPVLELADGCEDEGIKNLLWRRNGELIQTESRPLLNSKQLDELPFVTKFYKKHVDLRNYRPPSELYPFVDLFTGRGCSWGLCTFCLWIHSFISGQVYNTRSIENVMEEIHFVKENMKGVKEIFIQDDTLPEERAIKLSKAIIDSGLDLAWSCYVRGDTSNDTLKLMKKSGCRTLHVGYESSNVSILKNVRKGLTPETMERFTRNAKKEGLNIHGDFLMGLPGETHDTIKKTIAWAKKLDPDTAQFSIINPYPGTPFYDYLLRNDYLKDGEPNYPNLSAEEIRKEAMIAVREFYLNWSYAKRVIRKPKEYLLSRLRTVSKVIPHMFWKRW